MAKAKKNSANKARGKTSVAKQKGWREWLKIIWSKKVTRFIILPLLLYGVVFFIMQLHSLTNFGRDFYLDNGDGFQNVWNIWWVNKALVIKHTNPYFTNMLHWPGGVTLIPQTMNIYNGLVAVPLMHILGFSLVEAVNFAVVTAFMMAGTTMFLFVYKLYHRYWLGVLAGALFTFSSFHFAHAEGHLQLISLQFIPLFLLAFWTFLEKMRYRYALGAAGALFLVLLCDYYYLMWCIMVGGLWLLWKLYKKEIAINKQHIKVFAVFVFAALVLVGPLMYKLVHLNKVDPLTGSHDPLMFSLDPFMVFVPGGSWYWHSLTDRITVHWPFLAETSMFFGYGLLSVLLLGFYNLIFRRKSAKVPSWLNFWWIIFFVFTILALGPHLTIFRHKLMNIPLPYYWLEKLFPTLEISGMPVRWVLMALIAAIIIVTYWLSRLDLKTTKGKVLLGIFVIVSLIDLWPRQLPLTPSTFEPYVYALKKMPYGAVIDNGAKTGGDQLYNQTLHDKPQAFGYVTRVPKSVDEKDFHIFADLEQGRDENLCRKYKIRYLTLPSYRPFVTKFPIIYDDKSVKIYDLKDSPNC